MVRLLAELERTVQELEKYGHVGVPSLQADLRLRWTVERGLLAGLTTVFQIAEHILAAHFRRFPETYEDLLIALRDLGILPRALYEQFRGSGGFRHVLVQEYVAIDLGRWPRRSGAPRPASASSCRRSPPGWPVCRTAEGYT
ncbi:MAG: DUF86 domain-containing protein [Armatimonadota bacterium]|nr:DUF86 domain-containing protein [Armatimonadota bacterium]MDR7528900.1 DUF86 domain-containing protein [Armatimonadota bacterium]